MDQKKAPQLTVAVSYPITVVLWICICITLGNQGAEGQLREGFYENSGTCFNVEFVVRRIVQNAINNNRGTAAGLLRMHFHDCFVNGCDASVLIDSTAGNQAEKDSPVNNPSLHGFEVIDAAKQELENRCPGVVSCADILAFAARDSVFALGGPSWRLRSGRRDGRVSRASDVIPNIPAPTFNVQQLTQSFNNKGLSQDDMITLSGAHTIGVSHCSSFSSRLYNFSSTTPQDPSLDPRFAFRLKAQCPVNSAPSTVVLMDSISPFNFDNSYFSDVSLNRGLFTSDAALLTDSNTAETVEDNSDREYSWRFKFAQAMIRMSEIQVLTGQQGEVRKNCHSIN